MAPGHFELIRHTFNWQGHEENQISIDKGAGMFVGSDYAPNQKHHRKKKHIIGIELSPEVPIFKVSYGDFSSYYNNFFFRSKWISKFGISFYRFFPKQILENMLNIYVERFYQNLERR